MARSRVSYSCGCGFRASDPQKATGHCDTTGHTMTVYGTLEPDTKVVMKQQQPVRPRGQPPALPKQLEELHRKFVRKV